MIPDHRSRHHWSSSFHSHRLVQFDRSVCFWSTWFTISSSTGWLSIRTSIIPSSQKFVSHLASLLFQGGVETPSFDTTPNFRMEHVLDKIRGYTKNVLLLRSSITIFERESRFWSFLSTTTTKKSFENWSIWCNCACDVMTHATSQGGAIQILREAKLCPLEGYISRIANHFLV